MTEDRKWNSYAQTRWNPFTGDKTDDGKCEIVNRYGKMACWACSMAYRLKGRCGYDAQDPFKPTFHPNRLDEPLKRKKPTIFATAFMGDIRHARISWILKIIGIIKKCPQHTFLLLTKRPDLFKYVEWPDNVYFGTTVNLQSETDRIDHVRSNKCKHKWISFEPPFERIECDLTDIDGIAIGSLTKGNRVIFAPEREWIYHLVDQAQKCGAKVVIKDNLQGFYPHKLREWP